MSSCRYWLLTFLVLYPDAFAAVENSEQPMRVALGYLPPINCENTKFGIGCINNKFIERLQHFSGVKMHVRIVPYARATRMLENNQAELGLMLQNSNMPDNIIPFAKAFGIKLSVYTRSNIANIDFNKLRIGILRGQGINITKHLAGAHVIEITEYRQGIDMLALGRLEAILGPDKVLEHLFKLHKLENMISPKPILQFEEAVWLYCRKEACNDHKLEQLQQAVTDIKPEVQSIMKVIPEAYYE